ncbi:hypothetical protein [Rubritalea profundi]|nr:hypothetical protein [Rubritalea profundi]
MSIILILPIALLILGALVVGCVLAFRTKSDKPNIEIDSSDPSND